MSGHKHFFRVMLTGFAVGYAWHKPYDYIVVWALVVAWILRKDEL